jgi:hypothetical protein
MFVSVTRGIFILCHHTIVNPMVNLFVSKPEFNGANLPNLDLNSCQFFFVHRPYNCGQGILTTIDIYLTDKYV